MKRSEFQLLIIEKTKQKAYELYKQGYTTREVGKIIGKSHEWVARVVRSYPQPRNVDKH